MRCLVGLDDTDSSRGYCTTYLGYRIAIDLKDVATVLPYPRLVRLNPNIPFKTRGNAAVCLQIETPDPDLAYERLCSKVAQFSDVEGGANSGLVFLEDQSLTSFFEPLYLDALSGLVSPRRVARLLGEHRVRHFELGNGMGMVGAASSLAFDERFDHTYELIAYRLRNSWGTARVLDSSSAKAMDAATFPKTFNNYDHQKRKVLLAPHGPDPVFAGVRGDSPSTVLGAFGLLRHEEELEGHMVYLSNQHTDAHLQRELEWKAYSSGWTKGRVSDVRVGPGGHAYFTILSDGAPLPCAAYEPTGDLRRSVALLRSGDRVKVYGGVRRPSSRHSKVLNVEKFEFVSPGTKSKPVLYPGTYIASPRANRHLTKPLVRYGQENPGLQSPELSGWLSGPAIEAQVPA
ncbi:MAG: DUF1743 domain-containing protein [Thaumarchaeota archaeon]|nr:DUF1743 domain-containing protein [Nitrososphaerota archaeon]